MFEFELNTSRLLLSQPKANIYDETFLFIYSLYCDKENNKYALGDNIVTKKQLLLSMENEIVNNYFYIVAFSKTNCCYLGFIKGFFVPNQNDFFWLKVFVIDNNYRRNKYGTELYEAFEMHIKTFFGIKTVFISVHQNNAQALNFWDRQGFTSYDIVTRLDDETKNLQNINILKKILKMT